MRMMIANHMFSTRDVEIKDIDLAYTRYRGRNNPQEGVEDLAKNLETYGLHNPVKLMNLDSKLVVLAGWRRIMAAKRLGWKVIPANVYDGIDDGKAHEINVIDNAGRIDLSLTEQAAQIKFLRKERNLPVPELAKLYGRGTNYIYELLQLDEMPQDVQELVGRGELSLSAAVALKKFPASSRSMYMKRALAERWSVKRIEEERSALRKASSANDLRITPERQFDAVRFEFTPDNVRHLESFHNIIGRKMGNPGPFRCQFSSTIAATESTPPYVCPNDIEWVVLSPGDYYYGREEEFGEGDVVPIERRGAWMFACTDCVKGVFENVVFHPDLSFIYPVDRKEVLDKLFSPL
jgi:ParB/RepB/Spo0J family partition protein